MGQIESVANIPLPFSRPSSARRWRIRIIHFRPLAVREKTGGDGGHLPAGWSCFIANAWTSCEHLLFTGNP